MQGVVSFWLELRPVQGCDVFTMAELAEHTAFQHRQHCLRLINTISFLAIAPDSPLAIVASRGKHLASPFSARTHPSPTELSLSISPSFGFPTLYVPQLFVELNSLFEVVFVLFLLEPGKRQAPLLLEAIPGAYVAIPCLRAHITCRHCVKNPWSVPVTIASHGVLIAWSAGICGRRPSIPFSS